MKNENSKLMASKEAYAYTPGLKIRQTMNVSKVRRLPILGEVHVQVGDEVNYDTVVASAHVSGEPEMVNAATLLNVEPEELSKYATKSVGERVNQGDIMAAYRTLFGLVNREVTSPIEGTIESISDLTGQIVVRRPPVPVEVKAYIPGRVAEVLPKEGAIIETNAAFVQGIFGIGGETHGKIKMVVESPDEEIEECDICSEDKGMVLIGGSSVTLRTLSKCVEVGVSGLIVGSVRYEDLVKFIGQEIGVAITGHEEVGLTLIITEGFGRMTMSRRTFDLLKRFEGHVASVNGSTQIRAGVLRPEVVIPHEQKDERTSRELTSGMVSGTPVRIIRQPFFGAIGKVVNLPTELQKLQSESYARVLDVELESGKVVTVPRANVEIIEE